MAKNFGLFFPPSWLNFYDIDTSGLYYKQVTIVIYDRNDSGQYYKTTIKLRS